jgi:Ran GTPase-activating protein (RanGAP) involved in mRNA processing and transport
LEKLVNLKGLKLEGNPIKDEGARAIARAIRDHRHLEYLDVEGMDKDALMFWYMI